MGLFNFFKRNKKIKEKEDIPSPEQINFSESIKNIIGLTLFKYGFKLYSEEVNSWKTTIIYRKRKQYIKVHGSTHWHDHPYFYNISFGEGSSKDFFEADWNSISLSEFIKANELTDDENTYSFPFGDDVIPCIELVNKDIEKYGHEFLSGDLTLFNELRKKQSQNREPYKINVLGEDGVYHSIDMEIGVKQKKKFS